MYEFLKNLFPKALIKKNESTLRKILSVLYIGKRFQCTVCDFEMSRFITSKKDINYVQNAEASHELEGFGCS
jgi:hypothetical protein